MGDPWEDLIAPEDTSEQQLPLFSIIHDKINQAFQNKKFPKSL